MKKTTALQLLSAAVLLTALARAAVAADATDLFFTDSGGAVVELNPAGTLINVNLAFFNPRGLAFNDEGNLFVADSNGGGQGTVLVFNSFNSSHSPTLFGTVPGNTFLQGVAINSTGNVFVMAQDNTSPTLASTIYKFDAAGTPTVFGSTPGQSFGLTFDSAGNLLAADALDRTIYQFAPGGTRTVFASGLGGGTPANPVDLAFDAAGNLFVSMEGTFGVEDSFILEIPAVGSASVFAAGLNFSRGVAFDPLGNLFVAELGGGDILKFTPDGTGSVFAFGFSGLPEYVAFGPPGSTNAPDSGMTLVLLGMCVSALFCVRKVATA